MQAAGGRVSEERGGGLLPGQGQFDIRDKVSGSVGKAASAISKAAPGVAISDLSEGLPGSNVNRGDLPSPFLSKPTAQGNAGNSGGMCCVW